jgi:hypothetical protein
LSHPDSPPLGPIPVCIMPCSWKVSGGSRLCSPCVDKEEAAQGHLTTGESLAALTQSSTAGSSIEKTLLATTARSSELSANGLGSAEGEPGGCKPWTWLLETPAL